MNNKSEMFSSWSEVTSGERNRLVFEKLNKTYGAYQIRVNYDTTLLKAFSSTLLIASLLTGLFFLSPKIEPPLVVPDTDAIQIDPNVLDEDEVFKVETRKDPPSGNSTPEQNTSPIVTDSMPQDITEQFIAQKDPSQGTGNDTTGTNTENFVSKKGRR